MTPLLEVQDLSVTFPMRRGICRAVRNISFSLGRERLGIVGESGSGKSVTGRAILRLIRKPGQIRARAVRLEGMDLLTLSERQMRRIRGHRISMIMQDPTYSLNPVMRVGDQISEAYRLHTRSSRAGARKKTLAMLERVLIRDPERVYRAYPHELSGGMGQRVMIAMMLIPDPQILIADEPTSALDVTVQKEVLELMDTLVRERGMGLIFISHDLNVVSAFCDRVLIMYNGRVVEVCRADRLHRATHPYTVGLLNSMPKLTQPVDELAVPERDDAWDSEAEDIGRRDEEAIP